MNKHKLRQFMQIDCSPLLNLLFAALLLFSLVVGARYIRESSAARERDSLERAIQNDITTCYALEGFYPPSLSYLKEHYGLTYNEDRFFIDYRPIASNIRPDCTVMEVSP